MEKIKIEWYVCTYNEEFQLPFAIDYWKRLISDKTDFKVIVFDNMSTDNTVKLLSKYDWITIYSFHTKGEMNEYTLTYIRNNCWINSDADWVIMTDLDEVFYSKDIIDELYKMKEQGIGAVCCDWYALCGDSVPTYNGELLHRLIGRGYRQHINHREGYEQYGKIQLFNPKMAIDMHYSLGMHYAFPQCPIVFNPNIIQFHFDKGFGWKWKADKRKELWNRLNQQQKEGGICIEYGWDEESIRKEYEENVKNSVNIKCL